MDAHAQLRSLPLVLVLRWLGITTEFKPRKNDTEWFGRCPLHDAKRNTTSFSFHEDGRFFCFSCGTKGKGAIDFMMAFRKVGFQAAVDELKSFNAAAVPVPRPVIRAAIEPLPTENVPFKGSYEKFFQPHPWLEARGLTAETLVFYGSGYYENPKRQSQYNRSVLLKICRYSDGACVGYLSRNIGEITTEKPKYRFPANLHKHLELFGAFQLKENAPIRVLYLVESPFTVLGFHQKGFPAVSPFGWSLSSEQISIIGKLAKGVVYLPDRNKREDALPFAGKLSQVCWVKCPELPAGIHDPEQLSAEQIRALS